MLVAEMLRAGALDLPACHVYAETCRGEAMTIESRRKPSVTARQRYLAVPAFLIALLSSTFAGAAGPDLSSSDVRATHGAWQLRCGQPPGARVEKCALVQSVKAEDRPNVSLTVIFLRSYDGKTRILRVVAPLGVLLPTGLGLKIDNVDVGHAPFLKCGPVGCVAEVVANEDLIEKMKTGSSAVFIIFQTPEFGIGVPISLGGFSDGLGQLN
jgi:invasion protein IalB